MDRRSLCPVRRFHQRFRKRRVRVDVPYDLVRGEFHHLREDEFGQEFGHFRIDQVRAEDLAVFLTHDDFDEVHIIAESQRVVVGLEGKTPDLDNDIGGCDPD